MIVNISDITCLPIRQ